MTIYRLVTINTLQMMMRGYFLRLWEQEPPIMASIVQVRALASSYVRSAMTIQGRG